jgi:DNA modification methylase
MTPYYADDLVTIWHGDCRDLLPSIEADVIVTDPPYALTATGGGIAGKRQYLTDIAGHLDDGFDLALLDRWPRWMVFCAKDQLLPLLSRAAAPGGRWMLLTWHKPDPTPLFGGNYLPDTEYIVHRFRAAADLGGGYEARSRFILHPSGSPKWGHPTEKPVGVMLRLLGVGTVADDLILDPFMGSGTTLVAAKSLNRHAIGIEIEERYAEIAANRCRQSVLGLGIDESMVQSDHAEMVYSQGTLLVEGDPS